MADWNFQRVSLLCIAACASLLHITILWSALCSSAGAQDTQQLHFMFISSSAARFNTSGSRQAVDMAVADVNSAPDLLPGYSLQLTAGDSNCERDTALDVFFTRLLETPPEEVAVIGAGCSLASEAIAEVVGYYNLPMISYASSSEQLEGSYFFRTVPSVAHFVDGVVAFIQHFGWSQASILTQDEPEFRSATDDLCTQLESVNITVPDTVLLPTKRSRLVNDTELFAPNVRIFVLLMLQESARFVMCEAIRELQLLETDYQYVWLTPGWFEGEWWRGSPESDLDVICSDSEIEEFIFRQGVIAISHYPIASNENQETGGKTPAQFERAVGPSASRTLFYAYDAVWALAAALNSTIQDLQANSSSSNSSASSGSWSQAAGETLRRSLAGVEFEGVSGHVTFEQGSRALREIRVLQYRNNSIDTPVEVATITTGREGGALEFLEGESNTSLWLLHGTVPPDGSPISSEHFPLLVLTVLSYIYAAVLIVLSVICMIFNFIFRNRKLIRLTSPNLNYLIGGGVIVFVCSVFFFYYPPISLPVLEGFCGVRSWFAAIGYSLCFGTINTKMWRVFYIFHNPKPTSKKKPLKDWHLCLFVLLFVAVDLVILILATIFSTARLVPERSPDVEFPNGTNSEGVRVEYFVHLCESRYRAVWLAILFGYKAIVQGIGVFLAFRIRKVKIKVLNDSKEVVFTLYISSVILALTVIVSLAFPNHLNVYGGCYSLGIPVASTVVLIVVFFSKMVRLFLDPKGEKLFTHQTRNPSAGLTGGGGHNVTQDDQKVYTLERKVKELERELQHNSTYKHKPDTDVIVITGNGITNGVTNGSSGDGTKSKKQVTIFTGSAKEADSNLPLKTDATKA